MIFTEHINNLFLSILHTDNSNFECNRKLNQTNVYAISSLKFYGVRVVFDGVRGVC